jgi:CubicO group peptidase (beta-lactamase class C family)
MLCIALIFASQDHISRVQNGLLPAYVTQDKIGVGQTIEDRMRFYKCPGLSIALINNGKIEWAKGFGLTESGTKNLVNEKTLFQAGSISKSVSAVGALAMVQRGDLILDEDVNLRLKSWKLPSSEFMKSEKVTLERILNHSAGLTVHGFPGYAVNEPVPTLVQVLNGTAPANSDPILNDMLPGKEWRYSGGGYTIMQQLMIDVAKKQFPVLMKDSVLGKIGMKDSSFEQPLPLNWQERTASGHTSGDQKVPGKWHIYPEMAAAGLWTTPTDLAKFAVEIQNSFLGKSHRILSTDLVKNMLKPRLGDDGLGFFVGGKGDAFQFSHTGRDEGFDSFLFEYPNIGKGIVIMANSNLDNDLMGEIMRSVATEYKWPDYHQKQTIRKKVSGSVLQTYVGKYVFGEVNVSILLRDGEIFASAPDQPELELIAISDTEFATTTSGPKFVFVKDADGLVNQVTIKTDGREIQAKRVKG